MQAFSELGNYGHFDRLHFQQTNDSLIRADTNHLVLIQLDSPDPKTAVNFEKVIKAYAQRTDVTSLRLYNDTINTFPLQKGIIPVHAKDSTQSLLKDINSLITSKRKQNVNTLLVNSKGIITNGYDINVKNEMALLIKHVSILLPGNKKVDVPALKRQKEK